MDDAQGRKFGIADGLILVAGVAAGLGVVRATALEVTPGQIWEALAHPRDGWSLWYAYAISLDLGVGLVTPFVAAWTPACLLLQLTRPRPPWRRLRRRPGFVACAVATAVVVVAATAVSTCVGLSVWDFGNSPDRYVKVHLLGGILAGSGVLWCWATMGLCGACRPSPTWTDRLGRLTGVAWVAIGIISACYLFLAID